MLMLLLLIAVRLVRRSRSCPRVHSILCSIQTEEMQLEIEIVSVAFEMRLYRCIYILLKKKRKLISMCAHI